MQRFSDRKFLLVLAVAFMSGFAFFNIEDNYEVVFVDTLEAVEGAGDIAVVTDMVVEQMPEVVQEVMDPIPVVDAEPLTELVEPVQVEPVQVVPVDGVVETPIVEAPIVEAAVPCAVAEAVVAPEAVGEVVVEPVVTPLVESVGEPIEGVVPEVVVEPVVVPEYTPCVTYEVYNPADVYIPPMSTDAAMAESAVTDITDAALVDPLAVTLESQKVEITPQVSFLNRSFNITDIDLEQEHKALKKARRESMSDIIESYYFEQVGGSENFVYLDDGVYYLKFGLEDIWEQEIADASASFVVIDSDTYYLEGNGLYFVDLVFSQNIDYQDLGKNKFSLHSVNGEEFVPNNIYAFGNEVVLVYESAVKPEFTAVQFSNFGLLNGFYPLTKNIDTYKTLASVATTEYEAIVGDDISFGATKLSFGEFNTYLKADSTIAIKIPSSDQLGDQCAILLFGGEMQNDDGEAKIPLTRLSVVTDSFSGMPIDNSVIENFVTNNAKPFLGFSYVGDLEFLENYYVLYLNLDVPQNASKGRYSADIAFEVFCP